jgi:DNA-directed RNA polymerase subunit RPC12/RpoP
VASRSKSQGPAGIPWAVVVPAVHVVVDLATHASCPDCGNQVVLYICFNCKKPVWPERGQAAA